MFSASFDGVVDQQAQRQDQREQGHPVDGVAENQVAQQGHAQRHGHGQGGNERLRGAEGKDPAG
jgi:hypothetical protein